MTRKPSNEAVATAAHNLLRVIDKDFRLILIVIAFLVGCAEADHDQKTLAGGIAKQPIAPESCIDAAMANLSTGDERVYRIQVGDVLDVHFYLSPEFDDEVVVRPDGKVTLRLVGDLEARGLTSSTLAAALDNAYARELREPGATVLVRSTPSRRVYVDGEVTHPGAFPIEPQMSAEQAVALAGGVTPEAAPDKALLIRRDLCGTPTRIKFDLAKARQPNGTADEDVAMLPGDIVYIPRSGIANVDLFVKQYIRDVLPVEPYLAIPGS